MVDKNKQDKAPATTEEKPKRLTPVERAAKALEEAKAKEAERSGKKLEKAEAEQKKAQQFAERARVRLAKANETVELLRRSIASGASTDDIVVGEGDDETAVES